MVIKTGQEFIFNVASSRRTERISYLRSVFEVLKIVSSLFREETIAGQGVGAAR